MLEARIRDLAQRSYNQNIYTYTNFLNAADMEVLYNMRNELSGIPYEIFGGLPNSERVMVGFGSEEMLGYPGHFPISVIKVQPLIDKFSDELPHRDFLGALMNLGIEREMIGDILVKGSDKSGRKNTAFVCAADTMVDYIVDNLTKIKHTNVKCAIVDARTCPELEVTLMPMSVITASSRFDGIVSGITRLSRSKTAELFKEKHISLNGRLYQNPSYNLKPGDIISIKGYGKYIFDSVGNETRKGRTYINLKKYE